MSGISVTLPQAVILSLRKLGYLDPADLDIGHVADALGALVWQELEREGLVQAPDPDISRAGKRTTDQRLRAGSISWPGRRTAQAMCRLRRPMRLRGNERISSGWRLRPATPRSVPRLSAARWV